MSNSFRRPIRLGRSLAVLVLISTVIAAQPSIYRAAAHYWSADEQPDARFIGLRHYSPTSSDVPLNLAASDDVGVTRIELYIDQALVSVRDFVPSQPVVNASFAWAGTPVGKHMLQARVFDTSGNSGTFYLVVLVRNSGQNQPPAVNAGSDQKITLPGSASLAGTASDDGLPNPPSALTTTWSLVSGPGTAIFGNANALNTTASFSTAGNYVLRLTGSDGALAASDELAVTVNAPGASGSLSVTNTVPPSTVDLSAEGTSDWVHWGLTGLSVNRKSGVTPQIGDYSLLGVGVPAQLTGNPTLFSWSGGTPSASASNVGTGLWLVGLNNGFRITVPADTTARTLKIYVGLWAARGRLDARLSDGSAPDYVDTSNVNSSNTSNAVYTVGFRAASAGQTLTVSWAANQTFNEFGNVTLLAATLAGGNPGPTPTPTPTVTPTPSPTPTPTPLPTPPSGNTISLNPTVTHQTMRGWEATDQGGQIESPAWNNYKDILLDQAVNDLGINRIRLEVPSGIENPTDHFALMLSGQTTFPTYLTRRYEIINDNASPTTINATGFKWTALDHSIDNIVMPLRQRLQARGETLWVNANYVDFGSSTFEHKNTPAEYAEFVLATYQHMQSRYGFVPDSWEVVLEPDTAGASWSATQTAQAIKAAGDRLAANGFTPNFVAPSTTSAANATSYIDQIAATPGAMPYVSEFSYHRYDGPADSVVQTIASRAVQYGKSTAMLEWIGADHDTLHQDLKLGRNSSWQQYTLAFPDEPDNGAQYYLVNAANPNNPIVTIASRTKFLRQYFKFIRRGAVRIEALSGNSTFDPLAFINPNGKHVVVVKAASGGTFTIQGLPAASYGIKFTTGSSYNIDLADIAVGTGQSLTTTIPGSGVITIYAR